MLLIINEFILLSLNMKNLLTIIFLLTTISLKAQHSQDILLNISYTPDQYTMDINQYRWGIDYAIGDSCFMFGATATADHDFKYAVFGLYSNTRIISSAKFNIYLLTGIGTNLDVVTEGKFNRTHHRHYLEAGCTGRYTLTDKIFLTQSIKEQWYTSQGFIMALVGVGYKIR